MPVDLTLPNSSSPVIDPYKDLPDELLPFALFVHVELGRDDELARIEAACNSQIDGSINSVQRAPYYNFSGQSLRSAFDEHLNNLVATRRFDPFYFVAVVDKNWNDAGLIVVTMNDWSDENVCYVDQLRVPTEEVGLSLLNLQLSNIDWSELKEQYGSDDDDNEDNYGPEHQRQNQSEIKPDQPKRLFGSSEIDEEYSDGASDEAPNVGYWIGLYAIPDIDFETVMRALHPSWGPPVPPSQLICRPEGRVPSKSQAEAVAHAKSLHPRRCRNNRLLYRGMFLIIDTPNYEEDGVLLVRTDWDEKLVEKPDVTMPELAALGQDAETDTQRLRFANADTITTFHEIKAGYRPWKHAHKTFLAYAGPKTGQPSSYLAAVDKSFKRRKSGEERFLERNVQYPLTTDGGVEANAEKAFQIAVDQHGEFVYEARFCTTLCPNYFVYYDEELGAQDTNTLVVLVKMGQEGDWSTLKCKAGDAYQALCDIIEQKKAWAGQKDVPL